jgi:hypothetical protein
MPAGESSSLHLPPLLRGLAAGEMGFKGQVALLFKSGNRTVGATLKARTAPSECGQAMLHAERASKQEIVLRSDCFIDRTYYVKSYRG